MEYSSSQTLEALEQLKTVYSDITEVTNILPILVSCFQRKEDEEYLPEIISLVLGPTVQAMPLCEVDQTVLHTFLPLVKQYLSKTLSTIVQLLELNIPKETAVQEITKSLEVCVQVLGDLDNLLVYISSLSELSVKDVFSVPKNVVEIVCNVFNHCQKSKDEYKELFSTLRSELMRLFQKCSKVQVSLFIVLKEKLAFDCSFEDELQLLIDVLDVMSSMSTVVADLDTISMVEHWKAYALLSQTYAAELCTRLEVTDPANYLARCIRTQLSTYLRAVGANDKKLLKRTLQVTGLLVKVLVKLCEHYKGYMGDCHGELLNCLISLSAHSADYLSRQGVPPNEAAQVVTQISAGAAPLLSHLILDPLFVKEFLQFANNLDTSSLEVQVGYCCLLSLLIKKIIQISSKESETQKLWVTPDLPLVETVFKVLHHCSTKGELFTDYEDDIYERLLCDGASLIVATCTGEMFPRLETLLMSQLLQPLLWPAVFSSDLLCLVARFGSSELCLQLTTLVNNMLRCWPSWDWHRPEWVYVSWTQTRLTQLLSTNHLETFNTRMPSLSELASDIKLLLHSECSSESPTLFKSVMSRLAMFTFTNITTLQQRSGSCLSRTLHQLWSHVPTSLTVGFEERSHWSFSLYVFLVKATCSYIDSFTNKEICDILDVLMKVTGLKTTLFHSVACEFLRRLANKTFFSDSDRAVVCRKISSLFEELLEAESPLTKQLALESFSFFAYLTKYEHIVPDTVANSDSLQTMVRYYFERTPMMYSNTSVSSYLQNLQSTFEHKCSIKPSIGSDLREDNSELNPCKKIKTCINEDLASVTLEKIKNEISVLEEYRNSASFNQLHLSLLDNIVFRLESLKKQ